MILGNTLSADAEECWSRTSKILEDSRSLYTDRHVNTIWEGPTRGLLLPLTFEVLREFTRKFSEEATSYLVKGLSHSNPNVVGHSILALSQISPHTLRNQINILANRTEPIQSIHGSFGWEGSLLEYANHHLKHK